MLTKPGALLVLLLTAGAIVFGSAYLAGTRWGWLGLRLYAVTAGLLTIGIGAAIGIGAELLQREMRRGVHAFAVVLCIAGLLLLAWAVALGREKRFETQAPPGVVLIGTLLIVSGAFTLLFVDPTSATVWFGTLLRGARSVTLNVIHGLVAIGLGAALLRRSELARRGVMLWLAYTAVAMFAWFLQPNPGYQLTMTDLLPPAFMLTLVFASAVVGAAIILYLHHIRHAFRKS